MEYTIKIQRKVRNMVNESTIICYTFQDALLTCSWYHEQPAVSSVLLYQDDRLTMNFTKGETNNE